MALDAAGFEGVAPIEASEPEVEFPKVAAPGGLPTFARPAMAVRLVREHNMIATPDTVYCAPRAFYNSSAFMAENERIRAAGLPQADVGVTDAAGHKPNQHLVLARYFHFQALELHQS